MKITCLFRYSCALLFIPAVLCCFGCKQHEHKTLSPVNKATLLKIVRSLAQSVGRKNGSQGDGVKLLRTYAQQYVLVITGKGVRSADSTSLRVYVSNEKDFGYFDIDLPAGLRQQLSYQDFDKAYGPGIETPRPKEPLDFSVMYHVPGAGKTTIIVTSRKPPQAAKPGIYRITVML